MRSSHEILGRQRSGGRLWSASSRHFLARWRWPGRVGASPRFRAVAADEPMVHRRPLDKTHDWRALLLELTGIDLALCPACGARALLRLPLPAARAPPAQTP